MDTTVATPIALPAPLIARGAARPAIPHPTDSFAIASAICGFTAIVPVLSQIVGLALGIASLVRIRRARRVNVALGGRSWAWAGIVTSGFVLVSWIAVFALLAGVSASLAQSVSALRAISPSGG